MLCSGKYRRAYSKQALYTSTALNQYSSISQGSQTPFVPSYDADGNQSTLQTSTGEWTVSYNALNQASSFTQGSKRILCVYDYLNRRIEKALYEGESLIYRKRFIYRGYLQIAELDASTENAIPRKTYLWDPSEPDATRVLVMSLFDATGSYEEDLYYTHDAQKNTNALFGIKAGRRALYLYGAYGNLIKIDGAIASLNPFRFSSEYHDDELALIYYNYRYLNPKDGRWVNRDPIHEQGGINLYGYVGNDPVWYIDRIGLYSLTIEVYRYAQTEEAIYSTITVSSDDPLINKCCCLPQFYTGAECGVKKTENLLNSGALNASFNRENSPPYGKRNPKGEGLTSIVGRLAKHQKHGITLPVKPEWMSPFDYKDAINNEYRAGDRGDNIHAGANYHHSSGCVVIGVSPVGNNSYQSSLEEDMLFKASIACAKRKRKEIYIKTIVNKLPLLANRSTPIIPRALEVNEDCENRKNEN